MNNVLTFLDGATYAALWTTGPLLLPSLLLDESIPKIGAGAAAKLGRPVSSEEALNLTASVFRSIASSSLSQGDADKVQSEIWKSIPGHMALVMLAYLAGQALGNYAATKSSLMYGLHRVCPRRIRGLSSSRILCLSCSTIASLLMLNWGFGVSTYSGWVMIRFFTAFISGGLMTWGNRYLDTISQHSKENTNSSELQMMEEGQPFLSNGVSQQHDLASKMTWLDSYWFAGVASSVLLSGFMFYPLNRVGPHHKLFVFLIFIGIIALVDRILSKYHEKKKSPFKRSPSSASAFDDVGIIQMSTISSAASNTSLVKRRKQSNQTALVHQVPVSPTPQRFRINSFSSVESEVFFDCMDEAELGFGETDETKPHSLQIQQNVAQQRQNANNNDQIAIYSNRKVVYPDNTPAYVPVGEKISDIPSGYITLYRNNKSKAHSKYHQTQIWRRKEHIQSIHARPHLWYPKIKVAYPHHIHGFTPDGMPVVYESPGKMNLKELFRSGCRVEDMIFHYCYLMEYLSNLESVLTEIHSDLNEVCGDVWQEELAAYANAKQQRLQSDQVSFGFVVVMDISGASPSLLSGDVMTYLSRAGEINSLHYPGSMRRAIAVQAPFWLGAAWGAIKGVMPASVTVDLLSASKTMEGGLKQYINEDQIPVEYGGRSKFKLGEHPFEVGLRKMVETQPTDYIEDDESLHEDDLLMEKEDWTRTLKRQTSISLKNSPGRNNLPISYIIEWDDLGSDYVLIASTILHLLAHMLIGATELVLPILCIIPPKQGFGMEMRQVATVGFFLFATISLISRSMQSRISSITQKSPLSGFRIGFGSSGFIWLCIDLALSVTPPNKSKWGILALTFYPPLLIFSSTIGIASAYQLRRISTATFAEGNETIPRWCAWIQYDNKTPRLSLCARAVGMALAAPVLRWMLLVPFYGSSFIALACICGFLYTVSFSLHTVTPPPTPAERSRRKVSQFVSAMMGLWSFIAELVTVAGGDVKFLWKELLGRD